MPDLPRVLSTSDVARMLGRSKRYVRELINTGRLVAGRLGNGRWYIAPEAADELVERLTGRKPLRSDLPSREELLRRDAETMRQMGFKTLVSSAPGEIKCRARGHG